MNAFIPCQWAEDKIMKLFSAFITVVPFLALACSSAPPDTSGSTSDAITEHPVDCGPRLLGITCQTSDGSCEDLVCADGAWACPKGDVQVPLTPGSCMPHPKDCGPRLLGVTCQTARGSCESQVCADGLWTCPQGDVEVALTPGNCAH
jgi:hypothetical protein